jgi:MoxR-like ATPase
LLQRNIKAILILVKEDHPMDFRTRYPEFAAVEHHIRAARITRAVAVASALSDFVVDCWNALRQPAPPAAIIIDRRRESRIDVARAIAR